ncbi:hypothetical protein VTJ04DRAFT_6348 [Mycothermus thermophilus]|uniref:uncharacterized protein n=1 Tax=Humicola insolens TaxID=85995 RepID=UPI00374212BF
MFSFPRKDRTLRIVRDKGKYMPKMSQVVVARRWYVQALDTATSGSEPSNAADVIRGRVGKVRLAEVTSVERKLRTRR